MSDFQWITYRLATGGALTEISQLRSAGVTHVISLCEEDDAPLLEGSGINYLHNPLPDDGQLKPPGWFAKSLRFALDALSQPDNRVLAHCLGGVNRGPSTAYAILRAQGIGREMAAEMIRQARPITRHGLIYIGDAEVALEALGYCLARWRGEKVSA